MKIYQVDSFTNTPFSGNPAGVLISDINLGDQTMQNIAMEMNLAETAFVYTESEKTIIRFFTPTTEVPICGHATLAAAHIFYSHNLIPLHIPIIFESRSGTLEVSFENDWYHMRFPRYESWALQNETSLPSMIGIEPKEILKSENGWYIAILEDEFDVLNCKPQFSTMEKHQYGPILVTAPSNDYDYVMRLFAPNVGIPEDPVTGSAECILAPIWSPRLQKDKFTVKQLSQRSGIKKVELEADKVLISGQAITMFEINWKSGKGLPENV